MSKGYIERFVGSVQNQLILWFIIAGSLLTLVNWATETYLNTNAITASVILFGTTVILAIIFGLGLGKSITKPTRYIAQAILHVSPSEHLVAAPNVDELKLGRELVSTLTRQVYDYATATQSAATSTTETSTMSGDFFDQLPVATLGVDEHGIIAIANNHALGLLKVDKLVGENFNTFLTFNTTETQETPVTEWITNVRETSMTKVKTWQKIELRTLNNGMLGYFDVAVSFNKHSASGIETVITLYDHSAAYTDETSAISFIALAVHELRTPITILRGYIEAFSEELGPNATTETNDYLKKMNASAQGLTNFISNLLNVAKINQNELSLSLIEGNWNAVLPEIIDGLRNKAEVNGKQIELRMEPNLPPVGIDRLTVGEVITNLIDNAIKYSPEEARNIVVVSKLSTDGLIETTVKDNGVGIPTAVMPHLFDKFSRNHRNKTKIGGTGLGLYIAKAVINAHGGNIWASSKENEGSTFGFTLQPYAQLAKDLKTNNNGNIVQTKHGWIKNHSMQRR